MLNLFERNHFEKFKTTFRVSPLTLDDEAEYRCEITYEETGRWFKHTCLSHQVDILKRNCARKARPFYKLKTSFPKFKRRFSFLVQLHLKKLPNLRPPDLPFLAVRPSWVWRWRMGQRSTIAESSDPSLKELSLSSDANLEADDQFRK